MNEIKTIKASKGDVIIHTFDTFDNFNEVSHIHSDIVGAFPDNVVIAVPSTDSIHALDKQSTIDMLNCLIELVSNHE